MALGKRAQKQINVRVDDFLEGVIEVQSARSERTFAGEVLFAIKQYYRSVGVTFPDDKNSMPTDATQREPVSPQRNTMPA